MLPLGSEWEYIDFSPDRVFHPYLSSRPDGINFRQWTLKLLERYRFVIGKLATNLRDGHNEISKLARPLGETPSAMVKLVTPTGAHKSFAELEAWRQYPVAGAPALLCLNDDVTSGHADVDALMIEFMQQRWRDPAGWEVDRRS